MRNSILIVRENILKVWKIILRVRISLEGRAVISTCKLNIFIELCKNIQSHFAIHML